MIHKNIIIGSGFSSLGAILGLKKRGEKCLIITGKVLFSKTDQNLIDLPSRNFEKYKNNIYQSTRNNNLEINTKNNFISYIGFGGLSNLWGKIFNINIEGNNKIRNFLIKQLKIKTNQEINLNHGLKLFRLTEQKITIKEIYKSLDKSRFKTISSTVKKIKFNTKKKIFLIYLFNDQILKAKNIYLASGIFSTLKLLNSLDKKIFRNKIQLNHSDMCYGICFALEKNFKKKIGNEFFYFNQNKNNFAGRLSVLNENIINKYDMSVFFLLLYKLTKFFKIKILVLSVLYKRPANSSLIFFKNSGININVKKTFKNSVIINQLKKSLKKTFNIKFFIFKRTLVGSDFHYSCNIIKNINLKNNNIFFKNLFILDSSYSTKHAFFPTFQMIYESYVRTKNKLSINKFLNKNV